MKIRYLLWILPICYLLMPISAYSQSTSSKTEIVATNELSYEQKKAISFIQMEYISNIERIYHDDSQKEQYAALVAAYNARNGKLKAILSTLQYQTFNGKESVPSFSIIIF